MATHGSATVREATPHENRTTRTATIINALKHRAEAVLNDKSLDPEIRATLRHALETYDPWLARLVNRPDVGKPIANTLDFSQPPETQTSEVAEDHLINKKIEALAEIICGASDASAAALFVLMGTLQNSTHPEVLANTAKHFAFTRCGELNLYGMIDAHLSLVEGELLAGRTLTT